MPISSFLGWSCSVTKCLHVLLQMQRDLSSDEVAEIDIYVDGSGNHGEDPYASWAFLMVAVYANDDFTCLGCLYGNMECDEHLNNYIGATKHNSHQAELSA